MIKVIDLNFQNETNLIAAFVIPTNNGIILIETGPYSCHSSLIAGLKKIGYSIKDLKKVLLTHIHLDHSGGAWALAETGAEIMVHPFGAPHLSKPEKLINSATKIYGDKMEMLWSTIKPIDKKLIQPLEDKATINFITPEGEEKKIIAHHTPGHAGHHLAFALDEIIFAGDVLGLKVENSPVLMPSPPPEINFITWRESIKKLKALSPNQIYLTHFGLIPQASEHIDRALLELDSLENWYEAKLKSGLSREEIKTNFFHRLEKLFLENEELVQLKKKIALVNPIEMSHNGILRYFKKFRGLEPNSDNPR